MAVVDVRNMRVFVLERSVRVLMRARLSGRVVREVCALVVLIVRMTMVVRHGYVGVHMTVLLADGQADTQQHQERGRRFDPELSSPHALSACQELEPSSRLLCRFVKRVRARRVLSRHARLSAPSLRRHQPRCIENERELR